MGLWSLGVARGHDLELQAFVLASHSFWAPELPRSRRRLLSWA